MTILYIVLGQLDSQLLESCDLNAYLVILLLLCMDYYRINEK